MFDKNNPKIFTVVLISLLCLSFLTIFPLPFVQASTLITRVQGNARGTTSSASFLSATLASTPTSGNLLVAVIGIR